MKVFLLLLLCYLIFGITNGIPAAQPSSIKGNTPPPLSPSLSVKPSPNKLNPLKTNEFPTLAQDCDPLKCIPPQCRCSSTTLTNSIPIEKTPQLVMTTFDDAITALNYEYIQQAIKPLTNPDGCKAQATFFVSHEYTDYVKVHQLYNQGHEIALHSISHTPLTTYWNNASVETLVNEFGDQRDLMSHFAQINKNDIVGMRLPLFELSGNNSYIAMKKIGLKYDSSWPTQHFVQPGIWPYTLDYKSHQDCPIGRCPTASIPGVWVSPLLNWEDAIGTKCAMLDACANLPDDKLDAIFDWMKVNFNKTYYGNRAPFGMYLHASWFLKGDNFFPAYKKFLKYLNGLPDVYIVSVSRVIDYVRNPKANKPFDNGCVKPVTSSCKERFCQLKRLDNGEERWMKTCVPCPAVYPWVNNPLGKAPNKLNMKIN